MNQIIRILLVSLLISVFILLPLPIKAAVIINEISPSTDPEWVELYNDGETDQDVTGYLLEDGNSSHSDDLTLAGVILKKGYLVFNHNEGWLNNGGDTLKLYNNSSPSAIIDQHTYESVSNLQSVVRSPDGSENWIVSNIPSSGIANPNPTPDPTNTPTPTPTPTSTPTPNRTPTPTPGKTPLPSPTKKPISTPTTSPTETVNEQLSSESGGVLGTEVSLSSSSPSPKPNSFSILENKNKIIAALFICLGMGLIGGSFYFAFKNSKSSRIGNDI
jgi:hypothetical protein